jgi:uncharacterized protein YhaN
MATEGHSLRVERLHIDGFGRLRNVKVEFGERVTVITGLNESGKSTLHAALLACLFGFYDSPDLRTQADERALRDRHEPWDGGSYGLRGTVRLADGRRLEILWDFADRTRVSGRDADTGAPWQPSLNGRAENVLEGRRFWGVSRDLYVRAYHVAQGELSALQDEEHTVRDRIEAVAASGGGDASAQAAVDLLEATVREDIGTDRATARPLAIARRRIDDLEGQLGRAQQRRDDLEHVAARRAAALARTEELTKQVAEAERAIGRDRLAELERRVREAEQAQRDLEEARATLRELRDLAELSLNDVGSVDEMDRRRRSLEADLDEARGTAESAATPLRDAETKLAEVEDRLRVLDSYAEAPTADDLEALNAALSRAGAPGGGDEDIAIPVPSSELLELERRVAAEVAELESLHRPEQGTPSATPWLVGAILALVTAAVTAATGAPVAAVAFAVVAVALAGLWLVRRQTGSNPSPERLSELETRQQEAEKRRSAHQQAEAEARGRLREREQLEARAEAARREAATMLREAGYDPADFGGAVDEFKRAVRLRGERSGLLSEAERLRSVAQEQRRPAERVETLESDLKGLEERLRRTYLRWGVDKPDFDKAREDLEARVGERSRYGNAETQQQSSEARLSGALGGAELRELRRQAEELRAGGLEPLALPEGEATRLRSGLHDLREELATTRATVDRLGGELDEALRDLPEPAVLEEELAAAQDKVARLERSRQVLETARDTLEAAAADTYRDFAPRLGKVLGRGLSQVTDGRYAEVFVDEDLTVRLRSPERPDLVDCESLSRGTQEQIYLLQRLELVRLLGGENALPVLLDDPLVHCDDERREGLARLLSTVGEERQLIVLSTDSEVADLLERTCEGCRHVRLPEPSGNLISA